MPKVFISTALITGSLQISRLSGVLSETFPIVRKRYDGFGILFFLYGHGCGLGFLEQAESCLCLKKLGEKGEILGSFVTTLEITDLPFRCAAYPLFPQETEAAVSSPNLQSPLFWFPPCCLSFENKCVAV